MRDAIPNEKQDSGHRRDVVEYKRKVFRDYKRWQIGGRSMREALALALAGQVGEKIKGERLSGHV
jgi:hypothetical protein